MHTRTSYLSLLVAALLSAGCASQVTAPVRDGVGGVSTGTTTPAPASGFHTVRQGETLLGIARQYGVTLPDLVAWNNVTDPNQIHVGQTIRVAPSGKAPVAIAAPGGAVATPVPPTGTEAGAVPLVREPIGGRAPVAEPAGRTPGVTINLPFASGRARIIAASCGEAMTPSAPARRARAARSRVIS